MPRPLTPVQVGKLATHIAQAIIANPLPPKEKAQFTSSAERHRVEAWEDDLRKAVDHDMELPSYHTVEDQHTELLEFLVNYYANV